MIAVIEYETWTTKDGRVLRLIDMTDQHLVNAIAYLNRRANWMEMNQDQPSYWMDSDERAGWPSFDARFFAESLGIEKLEREAQRRGIRT